MAGRDLLDREAYWQGMMRQQAASGLSISAFCREHEVAEGSFFYWRRKLTNGLSKKRAGGEDEEPRRSGCRNNAVGKFIPVEMPAANGAAQAICEVVLPDGCRIIVPTLCDTGWLGEILGVLGDRAC